jgi:hypothetical protein
MRVICIEKPTKSTSGREGLPSPEVGDDDIVIREKREFDIDWLYLERFGNKLSYAKQCFALLDSDLDETTLVNEEFGEKYCVPVKSELCV